MGAIIVCCNEGMEKLLMPADGSRTPDFPGFAEPEPNSLLLLGEIRLKYPTLASREIAQRFFREGLGCSRCPQLESGGNVCLNAGLSHFILSSGLDDCCGEEIAPWPGQFYMWVKDLQIVWAACKALSEQFGVDLIEKAVCCRDERKVDALVVNDPVSSNTFMLNQAPKGFEKKVSDGMPGHGTGDCNVVAIIDALRFVPEGSAKGISKFYKYAFLAASGLTDQGCRVHFALGDMSRQTLSFVEDPSMNAHLGDGESSQKDPHAICIYMPSSTKFRLAFERISRAGAIVAPSSGWQEAEKTGEFTFSRCWDPDSGATVLHQLHIVRSVAKLTTLHGIEPKMIPQ